jgi:hypothetical protein
MTPPPRRFGRLYVALAGVGLATLSAAMAHDRALVVTGLVVMGIVGAGAVYVARRRP